MMAHPAILIAIFAAWIIPTKDSERELELGDHFKVWLTLVRYLAPAAVLLILLESTGVL